MLTKAVTRTEFRWCFYTEGLAPVANSTVVDFLTQLDIALFWWISVALVDRPPKEVWSTIRLPI
jgi:hypothetical protein